ncbi:hypothetical protein KBY66_03320 [Synechococcus sp. Tobar12-5m-g]|uniref:hypothetical protein n=1 Tax=unclassified Synechococcus TaxID=2626047 RepID=UPI0020CD9E25|nr:MULTISPECIES: hypothetical protein [unclassified Synechococcus]MCP9771658.1 hypothetical protein [Synechococcus sp. Tobar12-5m-g]MCP9872599.1 hypothetical protein [Synechococcus sp. Cruz CV-v-12]
MSVVALPQEPAPQTPEIQLSLWSEIRYQPSVWLPLSSLKLLGFPPLTFQLALMEQGAIGPFRTLEAPFWPGQDPGHPARCWLWDRQQRPGVTPRRPIYQLRLRTLTDQIGAECRTVIDRLGVSIPVYVLRGGQVENDYVDDLAGEAVTVGTIDQVVSPQLNQPLVST